jgi:hypothetical protein
MFNMKLSSFYGIGHGILGETQVFAYRILCISPDQTPFLGGTELELNNFLIQYPNLETQSAHCKNHQILGITFY